MKNPGPWVLSYDIGGSHASAGIVNLSSFGLGEVFTRRIDSSAAAQSILDSIEKLGREVLAGLDGCPLPGIAMSMPGPFDYQKGIGYFQGVAKYEQLYGFNLRQAMASRFPQIPGEAVRFINDAAAALLGEICTGAAKGAGRAIGLTLGTGIGSAFAVDGRIVTDGAGVPAEGYLYRVPWKGGVVEDFISSRGLQKKYLELGGGNSDVREIALHASQMAAAREVFTWFGRTLGEVLLPLVRAFQPEVIVVGGAISHSEALFLPGAREVLGRYENLLRTSTLFDRANLVGAGVAWSIG
jgi:glucokinase